MQLQIVKCIHLQWYANRKVVLDITCSTSSLGCGEVVAEFLLAARTGVPVVELAPESGRSLA